MSIGVVSGLEVHVIGVSSRAILEAEDHAPVGADRHRPESGIVSLEAMQAEPGQIHVVRGRGRTEAQQEVSYNFAVLQVDATYVAVLNNAPKCPVPKAADFGNSQSALCPMAYVNQVRGLAAG